MPVEEFDINKLVKEIKEIIRTIDCYPKCYDEFIKSFDSIEVEALEVYLKLTTDSESKPYFHCIYDYEKGYYYGYDYYRIFRDLAYAFKNEE